MYVRAPSGLRHHPRPHAVSLRHPLKAAPRQARSGVTSPCSRPGGAAFTSGGPQGGNAACAARVGAGRELLRGAGAVPGFAPGDEPRATDARRGDDHGSRVRGRVGTRERSHTRAARGVERGRRVDDRRAARCRGPRAAGPAGVRRGHQEPRPCVPRPDGAGDAARRDAARANSTRGHDSRRRVRRDGSASTTR